MNLRASMIRELLCCEVDVSKGALTTMMLDSLKY